MASLSEDRLLVIMKMKKCDEDLGVEKKANIGHSPPDDRRHVNLRLLRRSMSLDTADSERMDILWEELDDVSIILRSEPCKRDGTKPSNREMIRSPGLLHCRHVFKHSWLNALTRTGTQKPKPFAKIFRAFKMIVLTSQFRSKKMRTKES